MVSYCRAVLLVLISTHVERDKIYLLQRSREVEPIALAPRQEVDLLLLVAPLEVEPRKIRAAATRGHERSTSKHKQMKKTSREKQRTLTWQLPW